MSDLVQPATRDGSKPDQLVRLEAWEEDLLRKVRNLRAAGKRAMLFMTDDGAILVFRAEPSGRVMPT